MLEKIKELIDFPGTPVGSFAVLLIVDSILHRMQAYRLSYMIILVISVIMILSTARNYRYYGRFMKYTCLLICAFTILFMIVENPFSEKKDGGNAPYEQQGSKGPYSKGNTGYRYGYDDGYNDAYFEENDSFTMRCTRCHGTGKCEDCGGSGRSKLTGVLAAGGCALCDASGDCYKCGGKGYTVHH